MIYLAIHKYTLTKNKNAAKDELKKCNLSDLDGFLPEIKNVINKIIDFMLPVILGICMCMGYINKKWIKDVDNKYIPTIVAAIGVFLSIWINKWNITPDVILTGLISGLSSTGLHQVFKQFIENNQT